MNEPCAASRPLRGLPLGLLLLGAALGFGTARAQAQGVERERSREERAEVELHVELRTQEGERESGTSATPGARRLRLVLEAAVDVDGWRARLSDPDIDARERAFDELIARAAGDRKLRLALQAWSLDPAQPELAWSSRLALRELERQAQPQRLAWARVDGGHLQLLFSPSRPEALAREAEAPEPEPESADLRQKLRTFEPGHELVTVDDPPSVTSLYVPRKFQLPIKPQVTRRYALEAQPEGVVLYESVLSGGSWHQRSYEAQDLEQLLARHPKLRQQVPGLAAFAAKPFAPGSAFRWGPEGPTFRAGLGPVAIETQRAPAGTGARPQPTTLVLGVKCTPLSSEEAQVRLLGPGVGLRIEARKPGSVAEVLGLQRGDILVEIGGQMLCSPDEITRALRERDSERIEVTFIDRAGIERRRIWSPAEPAPEAQSREGD